MIFQGKSIFNASFDVYADSYHSVRPGYPALLFEDVKNQCKIDGHSRLLEIGAGSGIATVEIAKFGCQIVAIEPGANLAMIARKQTEKFENVEIIETTFENFQSMDRFDTILAFTSFHWLREKDKYEKVLNLLINSGTLVLVWNGFFQSDSPVTVEVNKVYHEFLPDIYPGNLDVAGVNESALSTLDHREQEIIQNPLFYPVFLRRYRIVYNYDAQTYPKLLNTFPKIIEIEEQRRLRLFEHISKIVKRHGKISVSVLTTLIICERKDYFLEEVANPKGE